MKRVRCTPVSSPSHSARRRGSHHILLNGRPCMCPNWRAVNRVLHAEDHRKTTPHFGFGAGSVCITRTFFYVTLYDFQPPTKRISSSIIIILHTNREVSINDQLLGTDLRRFWPDACVCVLCISAHRRNHTAASEPRWYNV